MKAQYWVVLLTILGLAACQKASSDPVARGEAYFNGMGCVKCHSIGDHGGTWGPNLTFIGFRKTPQWLDMWLRNPHSWRKETVMPNFNLTDSERSDIVAYLSAQKGQAWVDKTNRPWNRPDAVAMDSIHRGQVLFNKAGCVACHAQNGRGGYPNNNVVGGQIPSLTKVAEGYSRDELITKIRGGVIPAPADPSQPAPMVYMPKWGDQLSDDEIGYVADFLISLDKNAKKADSDSF